MGFKRPFDIGYFQELPFKQARLVDYSNKLTQFEDLYQTSEELGLAVDQEGSFGKSQRHEKLENNTVYKVANSVKDAEFSDPLSLVTSNSSDGDIVSAVAGYSSGSPEHSRFDYPQRFEPFDVVCISYLDHRPRRKVPLGHNHQANIPVWGGHVNKGQLEQGDTSVSNGSSLPYALCVAEEKLMGTCIMPMPDRDSPEDDSNGVRGGRKDCSCVDEGSIRCVRQHITEARVELKKSLGHEKFDNLGFSDMGEEVAYKWSEEEERVFHAVVYSNPSSLGQNFWKYLSRVFPTRSAKEIVSYYFNVFMLRTRAAQNRSSFLDIDSDDDELHGIDERSYRAQVLDEDNDSDIGYIDQCDDSDHGKDAFVEYDENKNDEDDDEDDNDDDDDNSDGAGDLGNSSGDGTGEDSGVENVSETHDVKSFDGSRLDSDVNHGDYRAGSVAEDFTYQDDSCLSFELQADKFARGSGMYLSGGRSDNKECLAGKGHAYSDAVDQMYVLDPCDARYAVPMKGVDLLPTCNIIEEIFGQGTSSDYNMK